MDSSTPGRLFHIFDRHRSFTCIRNVKTQKSNFSSVSLLPLLSSSPNTRLTGVSTRSNGISMLSCSNAVVYTYDIALGCFTKLADRWWAEGSDAWGWNRQRAAATNSGLSGGGTGGGGASREGLVAYVEGYCNDTHMKPPTTTANMVNGNDSGSSNNNNNSGTSEGGEKPQWWTEALTLGHLETRMYAAKTLDSPSEYKQALYTYARKIADEGFRWKAEELIKDLFGPIYWCVSMFKFFFLDSFWCRRPGRDDGWRPTIAGFGKRDLLKEVLAIFGASPLVLSL